MGDQSEPGLKGRLRALGLWSLPTPKGDLAGAAAASLVSLPISMTVGVIAFAPLGRDYAVQGVLAGVYGAVALGIIAALFGARTVMLTGPRAASALMITSAKSGQRSARRRAHSRYSSRSTTRAFFLARFCGPWSAPLL